MNSVPHFWQERARPTEHRGPSSTSPSPGSCGSRAVPWLQKGTKPWGSCWLLSLFPLVRPPGSAPRLLLSTEALAHSTGVLREQLGAPSHREGCPWQSPAESQHGPAQAQCLPLQWKSQLYSRGHGKHNSIISRESQSHPMLPASTARGTQALPLRSRAPGAAQRSPCCMHTAEDGWWLDVPSPSPAGHRHRQRRQPGSTAPSPPAKDRHWNQSPELPRFLSFARPGLCALSCSTHSCVSRLYFVELLLRAA